MRVLRRKITHSYRIKRCPIKDRRAWMGFDKGHKEFHALDMSDGWHALPGYPAGIQEKIVAGALDEKGKRGNRTRLLRFAPGTYTTKPFVHEYWEEVFLVSGDLIVGNDEHGEGGEKFQGYTYAVRPPGVYHGPFKSDGGCLLLETHFYNES
jgi:hypothetical protein